MNSLDSMTESIQNVPTFVDGDHNCTAIDKITGQLCGETESLKIIDDFQKLYENRIQNVDQEIDNEFDRVFMKLEISKEWIKDLREQNIMLVQVVEDLEQTASNRMKLLEQKLKQSSMLVSENLTKPGHTEKAINILSNRVNNLQKDEEYMRQRIEFLQSDIRGLLELIRRASQENRWNLDGIKFIEVQPTDIPAPIDCSCGQEDTNQKRIQSLKLQIEQFQENEKKMIVYQKELEEKLTNLTAKLKTKEDIIKKYSTQNQNVTENLKKLTQCGNQITCNSFLVNDKQTSDIVLVADIVEKMFIEKDLETRNLQQCLHNAESTLAVLTRDNNININNLKIQLNEKCRIIQEIKQEMSNVEKELLKKQSTLTAEVIEKNELITSLKKKIVRLQEQCDCTNIQIQFKEDVIKEMRKKLKQTMDKEVHKTQNAYVDTVTCQENHVVSYLTKVKSLMEQDNDDIFKLKVELEKVMEKLCRGNNKDINIQYELNQNIDYINKISPKKKELIAVINSIILRLENNNSLYIDNEKLPMCIDFNQQFKLMDIIRACAIEAQVTTEDIKDGMDLIACTFKSRHKKYIDLNEEVVNVQKQLIRNREKITEALNRLQLQEEERIKHNERITSGKIKLKDIKNEINHAQARLSMHLTKIQSNMQESIIPSYSEMSLCNDLVCSVIDEIEQTSKSLQVFHTQECCITSNMEELVTQLCAIESCIIKLQQKINEALSEHESVEITLCQKEDKLKKLEKELDTVHSKIQHVSEIFFNSKDQACDNNGTESQLYTQTWNEILQTKQDLHKLRKEHNELKFKMSQKTLQTQCKDKCLWKCKLTDLQEQVKILQHEIHCKQEANEFLRSSIKSMEEELRSMQTKAESYRRSHSMDSTELKKKIIQLENALKLHEERECILQQQLNENEIELNKSKELLNSFPNELSIEETLLRYECHQSKHDAMIVSQLFKTVENIMRSTKCDIQDFKTEFKKLIYEDQFDFCSSARSLMNLVDKLQKCEDELDSCSQEIEKLKNAVYSKNKLIEDRDKMIKIQKEVIEMTQSEIKELHQKLQEKIDSQNQILSKFEKEKKQLLKQNELQSQTIGHLQNAVVEAKRCIDQMGHRTMSDLQEKCETIRLLTICVEETQKQYSECFSEAAKQEKLMELQRNAINQLQQKICYMEYDNYLAITSIHITHYSMLKSVQEQLEGSMNDIQALKHKIDVLVQSKCYFENKYLHMKKLWKKAEEKLQEARKTALKCKQEVKINEDKACQSKIEIVDRGCTTENSSDFNGEIYNNAVQDKNYLCEHQLQSEIDTLTRENEDMKKQLEKYKLDFEIIDKELKIERENETYAQQISFEVQKMRDTECCLRYENEQLKFDLEKRTREIENLKEKLQLIKENDMKFEKLLKKLEDKQIQINNFYKQIKNNDSIIKRQSETIEELEKNLVSSNMEIKGYLAELNDAEEEMTTLHDRIKSLKNMLIEKSNDMTKLQADYEVLKNDNSILKMENNAFENKSKEDMCLLKNVLKEVQMQLRYTEMNYHRVTEDYHKAQGQLLKMTKREADLQKYVTNMEKEYCSKISNMENEKTNLTDCLEKVKEELENIQGNYVSKNGDHCKLQDICKSYAEQLEILQQQVETEQQKIKKIEESNCCMALQLEECREQNCLLIKEKTVAEQTNCEIISELQDTHRSLLELRKECQLKNKSLACISAELTETAISRSELCNQSQYIVSCIRIWMMEQRDYVNKLSSKLKHQQQQLRELEFAKKALLEETRKLKRTNHLLTQRLKRGYRCSGKNVGNVCIGCHILPSIAVQNPDTSISTNSKHLSSQKKSNLTKATRRISTCGNTWWFPKMKYLTNELRKSNLEYQGNFCNRRNIDSVLEESRDCGYQSSASK